MVCDITIKVSHKIERSKLMQIPQETIYTVEDIYVLPDGQSAELIDGRMYLMAPPNTIHQRLVSKLGQKIANHIDNKNGDCEVIPSPFAVFLYSDDKNYVEPDISIICDITKIDDRGCNGAPDWIIEIVSPSSQQMDYNIKLFKYHTAGVREYWIVNPKTGIVNVYDFEHGNGTCQYRFNDEIPICLYSDLIINISTLL